MRYLFYRDFPLDNLIDFFFPLLNRSSCIASCTYLAHEFSERNILINSTRTCMLLIDDLLGLFCLISGLITFKIAALQKSFLWIWFIWPSSILALFRNAKTSVWTKTNILAQQRHLDFLFLFFKIEFEYKSIIQP